MNSIEIQVISNSDVIPAEEKLQLWVDAALAEWTSETELVIRIVDEQEISLLNEQFRHKKGPTNILSFPFEVPEAVPVNLLGDLVVCAPVLEEEAKVQHKSLEHHWAHIIVHGVLHLLGYDHIDEADAEEMESKEIAILARLHINNPYNEVYDI